MAIGDGLASNNQRRHLYVEQQVTVGFFTDPTLCIGCKACEVACKEHNALPHDGFVFTAMSYDNTGALGASSYRHVKFVEETALAPDAPPGFLFLSDVCRHCERAGCLEACPTGAIVRTEVGSVFVQDDICNGCGYCVVSCPFGVIDRRQGPVPGAGGAHKCTFCYDRQKDGLVPACAKTCPTESIQFGPLSELRERAEARRQTLLDRGIAGVSVYDPSSVGGIHALFLTVGDGARFGLPSSPEVPTTHLRAAWSSALLTSLFAIVASALAFWGAGP